MITATTPDVIHVRYFPCPDDDAILRFSDTGGLPAAAWPCVAAPGRVDVRVRDAAGRLHYRRQVLLTQRGVVPAAGEPDWAAAES